jgi:hypothetical protein
MFREVRVHEIREVLRLWSRGESLRSIDRLARVDRKTVRRYVAAAVEVGICRDGGESQLTDEVLGAVCERVRPHRRDGRGEGWAILEAHHEQLKVWLVDQGLTVVKAHELLARQGVIVAQRTLHRYALEVLGVGRSARATTVRVADGEPGVELQVDFGRMGLITDPERGRTRFVWALIFTACYSRHCFVWLSFRQTTEAVIAGFEAAWGFFGGVFKVIIPDYVARNIIGVLFPTGLCARTASAGGVHGGSRGSTVELGHITFRARRANQGAWCRFARWRWRGIPPKNREVRWPGARPVWCWC